MSWTGGNKVALGFSTVLLVFLLTAIVSHVKLQQFEQAAKGHAAAVALAANPDETQPPSTQGIDLVLTLGFLSAALLGCFFVVKLSRYLAASLSTVAERAKAIASGDLSGDPLQSSSQDEIADLMAAVNEMQRNLREMVASVEQSSKALLTASERVSAGAVEGAAHATQQNEHAVMVKTAIDELVITVEEVSHHSSEGALATREAAEMVGSGSSILEEVLDTMRSIAESVGQTSLKIQELGKNSEQIGRIVAVINEIAEQTNLLALNAAIEAARAGEHGRGFAVVAGEVRRLADRTTKSTHEIAETIAIVQTETKNAVENMKADTAKVASGIETTARLSDAQHGIDTAVHHADDTVMQIAFSAIQQSANVDQIRSSIGEIARITQEFANGSQLSARGCEEITALATDLQEAIGRFRLDAANDSSELFEAIPDASTNCLQPPATVLSARS